MRLHNDCIPVQLKTLSIAGLKKTVNDHHGEIPIRVSLMQELNGEYMAEVDYVDLEKNLAHRLHDIFDFKRRNHENTNEFNTVLIIPTGIGAEIGGHAGDGNVIAQLIGSACDTLITHPNVVNASDLNEMPPNSLYVEGSTITRLLMGQIGLQPTYANKMLLIMDHNNNAYLTHEVINAVSSARVTLGIDCDILELNPTAESVLTHTKHGRASGDITHLECLFDAVAKIKDKYDAIALSTQLLDNMQEYPQYMSTIKNSVNPIGGIEAMLTHSLSLRFNMPFAHSPMEKDARYVGYDFGIVDPRKAPETASVTYLHCILKGLFKSPKIISADAGINVHAISCLIQPDSCLGLATIAAIEQEIPIIAVKTKTALTNNSVVKIFPKAKIISAENYIEAVGIMHIIKTGISLDTLTRPIAQTKVFKSVDDILRKT